MDKIPPCLWFDGQAEEAARLEMLRTVRIDIAALEEAYAGTAA